MTYFWGNSRGRICIKYVGAVAKKDCAYDKEPSSCKAGHDISIFRTHHSPGLNFIYEASSLLLDRLIQCGCDVVKRDSREARGQKSRPGLAASNGGSLIYALHIEATALSYT